MFELRDYQQESVDLLRESFQYNSKAILCIPTGGGKTVVFSHIALSSIELGHTVMIICDRKELIKQAYDKLKSYGLWPTIIAPGNHFVKNRCYVASVDTLSSRSFYPDVDLLIVDECHKAKFDKVVDHYTDKAIIIGATATPVRTGSQRCLSTLYDTLVQPLDVPDLIGDNFLAPAVSYGAEYEFEKLNQANKNRNEYNNKDLYDYFNRQRMYDGIYNKYKQFCSEGPTLIFNVNRQHSKNVVQKLQENGVRAVHVDGSYSNYERQRILNGFRSGTYDVVSNCSILTTGYDNDRIQNVIINRKTKSVALFLQMAGRGSRINPKLGKTHFNLVDMGSNITEHGFWEEPREWQLEKKRKRSGDNVAPVKECKQCEALIHTSKMVCPHCGYEFPREERKLVEADFTQLTRKMPIHLIKPINEMSHSELREYAEFNNYKPQWVYVQMRLRETNQKVRASRRKKQK